MKTGMMITALAGPLSNLVLAAGSTVLFVVVFRFHSQLSPAAFQGLMQLLQMLILLNVILALFNMIPVPPLDGSRVVDALLPEVLQPAWANLRQAGPILLIAIIVVPRYTHVSLFAGPLAAVQHFVAWLVMTFGC
jgi:Zn-dependent protease